MKRFVLAGLLALAATFAANQAATAGGWGFNASVGVGCSGQGCGLGVSFNCGCFENYNPCGGYGSPSWCCNSGCCMPPCCGYPSPMPCYGCYGGYGGAAYYPAYAQNYGNVATPGATPFQAPTAPAAGLPATTIPVGYYPYGYGYQTPSYWYGR